MQDISDRLFPDQSDRKLLKDTHIDIVRDSLRNLYLGSLITAEDHLDITLDFELKIGLPDQEQGSIFLDENSQQNLYLEFKTSVVFLVALGFVSFTYALNAFSIINKTDSREKVYDDIVVLLFKQLITPEMAKAFLTSCRFRLDEQEEAYLDLAYKAHNSRLAS